MRAKPLCRKRRHRALDAELARLVAACRHNAALAVAAHNQRLAFQCRVFQELNRYKKSIEVKVGNMVNGWIQVLKFTLSPALPYCKNVRISRCLGCLKTACNCERIGFRHT